MYDSLIVVGEILNVNYITIAVSLKQTYIFFAMWNMWYYTQRSDILPLLFSISTKNNRIMKCKYRNA